MDANLVFLFIREATIIHRVITSQPVHTRGYQEVGEGSTIVSLIELCQATLILHNSRKETLSVIIVKNRSICGTVRTPLSGGYP